MDLTLSPTYTNLWELPHHRNTHLFTTQDFGQSFFLGFSRNVTFCGSGVGAKQGLNALKYQCHESSTPYIIQLVSSSLRCKDGDLPDNHSAVSTIKQTCDHRWLGTTENLQSPAPLTVGSTVAICSTTDIIALPSCTTTNEQKDNLVWER